MLCPRCSAIFDKEDAKAIEGAQSQTKWKGKKKDNRPKFNFNKRGIPYKDHAAGNSRKRNRRGTFNPSTNSPTNTWVFSGGRKSGYSAPPSKWVKRKVPAPRLDVPELPTRYSYNNNYKGKQPMTRTQWRRHQRQKKATTLQDVTNVDKTEGKQKAVFEMVKKPAIERISPPLSILKKDHPKEDEEMTSNFTGSDPSLDIVCNVVSILPVEYDVRSEINEVESDFVDEMATHKPLCYYVMNNGCVEEQHAVFEKPDTSMKLHLKPLFIQAKINGVGVNKVLVDGGATINLLPQSFLGKIGLYDSDLKPHNIILTNYEGTSGNSLGAIELELVVGSTRRITTFMVVPSKANFNVLLGREWIHGVGVVASAVHQRIAIWKEDGLVENVEADQSYFLAEVNTITKKNFDKQLAHIAPVISPGPKKITSSDEMYSMKLQPEAGFVWEKEFRDHDFVMVSQQEAQVENESLLETRAQAYKKVVDSLVPNISEYATPPSWGGGGV